MGSQKRYRYRSAAWIVVAALVLCVVFPISARSYTPPPGVPGPEEVDFGGKTVNFWVWGTPDWFTSRFEAGGVAPGRLAAAEEEFNVQIEFQSAPADELVQSYATRIMAGDSDYDWWRVQNIVAYWPLVADGMLYPIENLLPEEYYGTLAPQDYQAIEILAHGGQMYGFGHTYGPWSRMIYLTQYNQDLLTREGLPDPYELYQEGAWTWEAVTDLANKVTRDTTGDGNIDQWGLSGWVNPMNATAQFVFVNHGQLTREDEEGRIEFAFHEEEAIEALEQLQEWYAVDEVYGGWMGGGNLALYFAPIFAIRGAHGAMDGAGVDDQTGLVPLPWGPRTTRDVYPVQAYETHVLPANVAEPEAMLALHSYIWQADDHVDFQEYMLRGPHNPHEAARTREAMEILRQANEELTGEGAPLESILTTIHFGGYGPSTLSDAMYEVISGRKDAMAAMREVQPVMQSKLDDLFMQ